jgi:hypothetical protein
MARVERRSRTSINQGRASLALFVCVVLVQLYQLYDPYLQKFEVWVGIDRWSRETSFGTSGSFLVIVAALVIYFLKRENRFVYGFIEICFALVTTWFWAIKSSGQVDWLGCGAVVYLLVAGLENCFEGYRSTKKAEELDIPC